MSPPSSSVLKSICFGSGLHSWRIGLDNPLLSSDEADPTRFTLPSWHVLRSSEARCGYQHADIIAALNAHSAMELRALQPRFRWGTKTLQRVIASAFEQFIGLDLYPVIDMRDGRYY